jgi:hypothetical protein
LRTIDQTALAEVVVPPVNIPFRELYPALNRVQASTRLLKLTSVTIPIHFDVHQNVPLLYN